MNDMDPLLTLDEVGAYLGVTRYTVRRLIANDKLRGTFVGRRVVVRQSHLTAYLDDHASAPKPHA